MCGIAGIFSQKGNTIDRNVISKSISCIEHRGPDDEGIFCEGSVALGHRRLSIIDLSEGGHQPMFSDDHRYVIVYNGEVYNFLEIRSQLVEKGYVFQSHSDTEVVLKAYIQFGEAAFSLFNGMFAVAIYDRMGKTLVIARDRFGIKPLYYFNDGNHFAFGSEIKCILATNIPDRKINFQALSEYTWYGNPLGRNTMFEGIDELLPGHIFKVNKDEAKVRPYNHFSQLAFKEDNESVALNQVRERLDAAVRRHLISDVPVGIFLSGGIDSSAITAFASKYYGNKIQTFSVGFDFDKGVNELQKAAFVAQRFGTQHSELHVSAEELIPVIEELVRCHDEPFADAANIPLFLLCREIKGQVKVVLQGDGGDEIFGGYSRYRTLQDRKKWLPLTFLASAIPKGVGSNRLLRMKRFLNAISMNDDAIRHALLLTVETPSLPPENIFSEEIKSYLSSQNPFDRYKEIYDTLSGMNSIDKLFTADAQIVLPDTFLEKVDKSTMAYGIEIRVPFLDKELTDYVMSLPAELKVKNGEKKYLLKQSLRGLVPDSILDAPKTGFGVPYSFWLQEKLSNYLVERITDSRVSRIFDQDYIDKLISRHKKGKGHSGFLLWKALQLAIWVDNYNLEL